MGWYSYKYASDSSLANFMKEFEEKLLEAGGGSDSAVTIDININGDTQETLTFNADSGKALKRMLRPAD